MKQVKDKLYASIVYTAFALLIIMSSIAFLISRELSYVYAILLGGGLSIAGFFGILLSTAHLESSGNLQRKFAVAYIFRYLIYFAVMFLGAKAGLNILLMLVGFLCINLSIKWISIVKRKEES